MNNPKRNPTAEAISLLARELGASREQRKVELEWFKSHFQLATKHDLKAMERRLLMNAEQLTALLNNQTTQIGKIAKEQSDRFDVLTARITELTDLINDGGAITPEVVSAAEAVQTALDSLDASIPDAPTTA